MGLVTGAVDLPASDPTALEPDAISTAGGEPEGLGADDRMRKAPMPVTEGEQGTEVAQTGTSAAPMSVSASTAGGVADTGGGGAPDPALLLGCGVAAAATPQAAPGGVEGEGGLVVEASSKEKIGGGSLGVRSTCNVALHPACRGALVCPDARGGGGEWEAGR